jgi:hypothetical protein
VVNQVHGATLSRSNYRRCMNSEESRPTPSLRRTASRGTHAAPRETGARAVRDGSPSISIMVTNGVGLRLDLGSVQRQEIRDKLGLLRLEDVREVLDPLADPVPDHALKLHHRPVGGAADRADDGERRGQLADDALGDPSG